MAKQQQIKQSDEQLHWFWKLTTKWWFFPLLYVSLALIFSFIYSAQNYIEERLNILSYLLGVLQIFPLTLILMPFGIFYFIYILTGYKLSDLGWLRRLYIVLYFGTIAVFLFNLVVYKYEGEYSMGVKHRWMIITLLLVLILSFAGCVVGTITGTDYTGWHP